MKKNRKLKRLKRKVKEAEERSNRRIMMRMAELQRDESLMAKIDAEIDGFDDMHEYMKEAVNYAKREIQAG